VKRALLALVALLALPGVVAADGQRYALLIGIGDYTGGVTDLEGPPHDLDAIRQLLIEQWGFSPEHIQELLYSEATRARILAGIDSLQESTRPGDFIFLYFSGHGTSSYELTDVGLDGNTGALVPSDLDLQATDLREELIVGSRDLRPRLERLDRDRHIFAAFDACYSGAAVRSLRAVGRPRYVALPTRSFSAGFETEPMEFGALTAKSEPYPYQNLLYVSAAARFEAARDVTTSDIQARRATTVDGRPHGAFTNALLAGLSGAADTNADGVLTYGELYEFLRNEVSERFPQQPQLLAPEGDAGAARDMPVLGVQAPTKTASRPVAAPGPLRVRLEGVSSEVESRVSALQGVERASADGVYDVLLALEDGAYRLYHGSGDVLASYSVGQSDEAVERVAREVKVRRLLDLRFEKQDFNVSVSIPGHRGFLTRDEQFSIELAAEAEAHLLLLNVDSQGHVSVLYPFEPEELRATRAASVGAPEELRVSPPFGTEHLKLFAFRQKPPGLEHWIEASFSPLDPQLDRLIEQVSAAPGSKAEGRLKLVTRETVR